MYLLAALRTLRGEFPDHGLSNFVDDLAMRARHATRQGAVAAIKGIADRATDLIQTDLGLPFAPDKAVTLASSKAAQQDAHRALGLPPPRALQRAGQVLGQ